MKWQVLALFCAVAICNFSARIKAKSLWMERSMIVAAENIEHRQKRSVEPSMTRMHIKSIVKSRFARVITTTTMENSANKAKEITFSVRLPTNAFISKFTMNVDGTIFVGKVKEKERARQEYQGAINKGNSAGLVTAEVRETEVFNVAANVPAHASVTFSLEYQELLKRRLGSYEQVLFINPGQIVDDLSFNVYITEEVGITTLEAHHPQRLEGAFKINGGYDRSGEVGVDVEIKRSKHQALVSFKPTQAQQRQMLMIPEDERKVRVIYDVTRQELGGEILMRDGYFVHFFAPENLPVLPKRVVFVIDESGSMSGTKMKQTKEAFSTVLRDMSDADEFNIIAFSDGAPVWRDGMVPVTKESVDQALAFVDSISSGGGTNLNQAALGAADLLAASERRSDSLSAIIVLTDGDPTVGVTNVNQIRQNVKSRINGAISLFCIGFGSGVNLDFLKKLANDNDGIARKIYEDSDAAIQLQGFFQEVATPLLLNINFRYIGEEIAEVSKTNTDKYFKGSEVVVVGTMREQALLEARITGMNDGGEVEYSAAGHEVTDFSHSEEETGDFSNYIERLWAYFTIRQLLEEKVLVETKQEKDNTDARATALALKYGFVTPSTSMVVVLPEDEITTTASAISSVSPIPVCLRRGVDTADDSNPSQIWCPHIFTGRRQQERQQDFQSPHGFLVYNAPLVPRSGMQRQHSPIRTMVMNSMVASQSPSLSLGRQNAYIAAAPAPVMPIIPPSYSSSSYIANSYAAYDYDSYNDIMGPQYLAPPEAEVSTHCGELLNGTKGRITFAPSVRSFHTSKFYCDWEVELPSGSWIDLSIHAIKTSSTTVKITSNGEVILQHGGAKSDPKSFYVMSNRLDIRMTVDPTESANERIRISYKRFVPGAEAPREPATDYLRDAFLYCGRVINSDRAQSGNISSPGYPSAYPPNARCSWQFNVSDPETQTLSLRLHEMDIETNELGECVSDSLIITPSSEPEITFCGVKENIDIDLESSSVTVSFKSDGQMQGSGFLLNYEFVAR